MIERERKKMRYSNTLNFNDTFKTNVLNLIGIQRYQHETKQNIWSAHIHKKFDQIDRLNPF